MIMDKLKTHKSNKPKEEKNHPVPKEHGDLDDLIFAEQNNKICSEK